jgi:antibiotic biosynthesis monooxygenase (ABM) superfamily enzyme
MQKILENDYFVKDQGNEVTNANGVCEWFTRPLSRPKNTSQWVHNGLWLSNWYPMNH